MTITDSDTPVSASDRWQRVIDQLAATPRRNLMIALMDVTEHQYLSLPQAAESSDERKDSEVLSVELIHHHLPKLTEAGYIEWEKDPFCVHRGPNYTEINRVLEIVFSSVDQLPCPLINGCESLERRTSNS